MEDKELNKLEQKHRMTKKSYMILSTIALLIIFVFLFACRKSNQEIYNHAKALIEEQKYDEGIKELKSIESNFAPAKALLGKLLCFNDSVERDYKLGEKLLWEAYNLDDRDACVSLLNLYRNKAAWDTLYMLSNKRLEWDSIRAIRTLAGLYFVNKLGGDENVHQDYKKVEYYASKTAKKDGTTSYYLGMIYCFGDEEIKDNEKAFYWWNNGAKLGDSDCCNNLGYLYLDGVGINQNFKKAFECFKKAIDLDKNNALPYYFIAKMFMDGQYVKANRDSMKYYLQKAKDLGHEDALILYENEF